MKKITQFGIYSIMYSPYSGVIPGNCYLGKKIPEMSFISIRHPNGRSALIHEVDVKLVAAFKLKHLKR